ncbi:unnamed protein product [Paramecium sonneborni]|uniref:Uncharacterized protein n=1 Tax=Paramecium sonneborni TaxID=65129 RepID=A0A8S1M1S6_9CILI|nr:unnamed protein product [Paramecium sonneborni]
MVFQFLDEIFFYLLNHKLEIQEVKFQVCQYLFFELYLSIALSYQRQVYSSCNYIKTESTILSLSNPQQEINVELESEILNSIENIGYGLWIKYQPFISITDISNVQLMKESSGQSDMSSVSQGQFVYLLQQKETKLNILAFYISISDQTQTITHNVFYSFKQKTDTLVFNFEHEKYEGQWILFYFYFNLEAETTIIGFFSFEQSITTQTQIINDMPALVKEIRHQIGGEYEITNQLGEKLQLNQFLGRLSTVFSSGSVNIYQDLENFLLDCKIETECQGSTYTLSNNYQAFFGQSYSFGTTNELEYPIYVIKGWLKLQPFDKSPLDTVIFRVTINQDYQDDLKIGDKDIYLQYHQNSIPESNGFTISTYSYTFPTSNRYTNTATYVISDFEAQYLELLIKWHYIQYEIGTNNNQGQPIFKIHFPSLINKQRIFQWNNQIKHFTGTKMQYYVGGNKQSTNYLRGHISDMQLITYCTTPIITLSPNCHYSCLTCDGPNSNNCLSCPLNSQRIQSSTQKICACKKKYLDIQNQAVCQQISEIFPYMTEVESELQCDSHGYDVCTEEERECSFGYFNHFYYDYCLQCPGYSSLNTRNVILCSNCLFYPEEFKYELNCYQDTITYKNNEDYSYSTVKKLEKDIEQYDLITNENGDYELFLMQGFLNLYECKNGYFQINDKCISCVKGCQTCQNESICETCYSDYALTLDQSCTHCQGCLDCTILSETIICNKCAIGTYLSSNGSCIPCGQNCSICDSNGICQYCVDPSMYFQTFDGHNCQPCSITNCIYCYQYYFKNGIVYTTLDNNYEILESNQEQFFIGCALCQPNLYYNQVTMTCSQKPPTSQTTDDCTFGIIINSSGDNQCLISSTKSNTSTQNTDCLSISNCQQCIKKYNKTNNFCIVCVDGFYSSILTGQCLKCDSNCKTCAQQSQTYQDYWKWNIKAYYKYVFNQDDSRPFESYDEETFQNNFEVICTSCPLGFILNQLKCIKNCDLGCNKCEIINGIATCIQCQETPYGFLKSRDSNGNCMACPNNCEACLERTDNEIKKINPYFIPNLTNKKYTRKCFEKFNLDSPQDQYFYDQFLKTITVCQKYNKCYHQVIFVQNIYCSQAHFNSIANSLSGETLNAFKMKNIYISDLFKMGYLSTVETQELFWYLNEKVIRKVVFEYTLIQKQGEVCTIPSKSKLNQKIQQNVFAVQTVDLKFIGQFYPTIVIIKDSLTLGNFTAITFKNIKFVLNNSFQVKDLIYFQTKSLEIQDCILTAIKNIDILVALFQLDSSSLNIINLIIENLICDGDIFKLRSSVQLKVHNLNINNSHFLGGAIFRNIGSKLFDTVNIHMKSINISNTTFERSAFMVIGEMSTTFNPNVLIQEVMLNAVTVKQSQWFRILVASEFKLQVKLITLLFQNL